MKRWLYLIHRWAGIAVALFMLVWFVSGLVIMYAGSSALSASEQLAQREPLQIEPGWLSLGEVWQSSAAARAQLPAAKLRNEAASDKTFNGDFIASARLVLQAGQPLWQVENGSGQRFALSARDGSLHIVDANEAKQIAQRWIAQGSEADSNSGPLSVRYLAIRYLDTGPQDSAVRNVEYLRPFHRFAIGDSGRELLISARTGDVVRDSTALARGLYLAGNWIHLLRPIESFGSAETRGQVQIWSVSIALGASLTGLIIGWQRWRPGWFGRATYSKGRVHPYRDIWNTWHFWVGLIGGTAALLWTLSGLMNTNPFQLFSPANSSRQQLAHYGGAQPPHVMLHWRPVPVALESEPADTVALEWQYLDDDAALFALDREGRRSAVRIDNTVAGFEEGALVQAATRLLPATEIAKHTLLADYDNYYYRRHDQSLTDRPLPVLRVEFADDAGTRLYLDPQSGRVLLKQDVSRRVYRWLYSAFHHWDFGWLQIRPLWDAWMLPLVLMGVVLGGTSVVLGWKRLQTDFGPKKKKSSPRKPRPVREAPVPPPRPLTD